MARVFRAIFVSGWQQSDHACARALRHTVASLSGRYRPTALAQPNPAL